MLEKIIELLNNEDLDGIKELIKHNYDEVGELIFNICVGASEFDKDTLDHFLIIIKLLMDNGHKCDYVDANGNTALLAAVKSQIPELVLLFNDFDELFEKENNDRLTPVALSLTLGDEKIKLFCVTKLNNHVNDIFPINGNDMTYFSEAIFTSTPEICKAIALNDNFNYEIHKNYLEDVEWDNSDDDKEKQLLIEKLENDNKFVLEEMDEYQIGDEDSDIETMNQGLTPLMQAVLENDSKVVLELLKQGAQINHRNTAGFTPLMLAIFNDNYEMTKMLIENGAFINFHLYNGLTPITKAYIGENEKIFNLLLENNVYIDDNTYNALTRMKGKSKIQEKMTEKIKKYKNPLYKKYTFPFEYMYELGYDQTAEGDGFYGVRDVFNEEYGFNMITSANHFSFLPVPILKHEESKERTDGIMTRGPVDLYQGASYAILFQNGKVEKYDLNTGKSKPIFKGEKIKQIESTNYSIIGLTEDGRVLIDDNRLDELNVICKWKNIKKIAAGNSSIYAFDKNGKFYDALTNLDKSVYGDSLNEVFEALRSRKIVDIGAHSFNVGIVSDNGEVRLLASGFSTAVGGLVNDISDATNISVNNHFVILRKDKTLLAFGDNSFNQCNIAKWHDIERVEATHFGTIGYATDGEILSTNCLFYGNGLFGSMLKQEGFGNLMSRGMFVRDAISLEGKGEE